MVAWLLERSLSQSLCALTLCDIWPDWYGTYEFLLHPSCFYKSEFCVWLTLFDVVFCKKSCEVCIYVSLWCKFDTNICLLSGGWEYVFVLRWKLPFRWRWSLCQSREEWNLSVLCIGRCNSANAKWQLQMWCEKVRKLSSWVLNHGKTWVPFIHSAIKQLSSANDVKT